MEHQLPVVAGVSAREVHGSANSRWLTSYTWSDGLGRELQTKVQAEDGEAFTIVNGSVVSVAQQRAASLTMLHNNTPQVIDLDTLGRPVRVTDDNGSAGSYSTYSRLDILGRITQVTDAKGRLITRHFYSIDGQPVHVHNIDSGHRWVLFNTAQKPIHQWDNRSNYIRRTYDAKQQPLEVLLQENGSTAELLTEQYSYGDASAQPYFRGRLIQSLGQEGKTTINQYDFKGNVLTLSTQVCDSYTGTINWHNSQTMGDSFTQSMTFDAMNRPTTQTAPNLQTTAFTYGKGSLLDRVSIDGSAYLTNIAYNARGQRTDVWFANGSKTRYEYDSDTFRLTRLLTTRNNGVDVLQDISYTYDPEGNIVQQSDAAQQIYYFNNSVFSPTGLYEYDALYRLIKAQGRELTNLGMATESDFVNTLSVPNAGSNAMQNYTQMFSYDELGNLQTMQSQGRWSRSYIYDNVTNRLLRHEGTNNVYTYDAHGNMTSMPHLSSMAWNSSDMLRSATNGTFTSYYSYNAAGDRVRKVVEKGNIREERIYLGNYERYRKYVNNILKTERQTVHIIDDRHRFTLIDRLTIDNGITLSTATNSVRYQYDNHLGSASLELDQTAAIISYEEYHPFGTTSYRSGRTETEVSQKRYKYVGKERDEETGLYYYGARYYAAWLCRFVSVDPLQFKYPHYTPYQYAGNKPVSYIDLDGLEEAKKEESKTGFYIKEGDDKAKSDIFELAQGEEYIDISETGSVTMSRKFYKLSSEKQTKLLDKNEGLKLIYDLTSATYTDENGTVKDAKILYQTEGDFQFNGFKEKEYVGNTCLKDWEGKSGDVSNVNPFARDGNRVNPTFFFNASITDYSSKKDDIKQPTLLPKSGFQGQIAVANVDVLVEEKGTPRFEDSMKNGKIGQEIKIEINTINIRLRIIKHELRENLFRLGGLSYDEAHNKTMELYDNKGGEISKETKVIWRNGK